MTWNFSPFFSDSAGNLTCGPPIARSSKPARKSDGPPYHVRYMVAAHVPVCINVKKQSQMCRNNLEMTLHCFYMYRGTCISGARRRSRRCSSREFTSAIILALRPGTRKSNLGLLLRSFERNGKTCIQPCRATTNICPPARGPDAKKGPSQSVPKREAASFLPLHHCYVVHSCCMFQNNVPLRIGKEMCLHCSLVFPNSKKTFVKKKWAF